MGFHLWGNAMRQPGAWGWCGLVAGVWLAAAVMVLSGGRALAAEDGSAAARGEVPGPTHTLRRDFKHFEDVVGVPTRYPTPHSDTFFVVDLLEEADREAF